jgi:hypothetical protein
MTALTATSREVAWSGHKRFVTATLPTINDADTYDTGLSVVEHATVAMRGAGAAADSVNVNSISGGTLTFAAAGTARAGQVFAVGR